VLVCDGDLGELDAERLILDPGNRPTRFGWERASLLSLLVCMRPSPK
jgi:hypothetical protein